MARMRRTLIALVAALVVVGGAGPALAGTTAAATTAVTVPASAAAAVNITGCRELREGYGAPAPCQLVIARADGVCVAGAPTLDYAVEPEGTPNQTVTITWINPDGDDIVQSGLPLTGQVLWPGTVVENGVTVDWPGWTRNADGTLTEGDEYDWTRDGVQVLFQVNPSATTTVAYPPATSACADPFQSRVLASDPEDLAAGDASTTSAVLAAPDDQETGFTSAVLAAADDQVTGFTSAVLAATGLSAGPAVAIAGALLVGGALLVLVAARRRRRSQHVA